jgi:four helix bundle protein
MQDFRNLKVWQVAHQLVIKIYVSTKKFPKEEQFGLTSQIRRSSISIPSNIAEGCGRGSDSDFARFLQIALGSASELEYQIYLANQLGYISESEYPELNRELIKIKKMLSMLRKKLKPSESN